MCRITFNHTRSLFMLQLVFFVSLASVFICVCIQFADRRAGIHPNRGREGGWGRWLAWGWMRVVVQNYREELLLALAVSAVTVERPKQLRSTHPHHPSPSSSLLPSPSLPSAPPPAPPPPLPNIKGSLWHSLG